MKSCTDLSYSPSNPSSVYGVAVGSAVGVGPAVAVAVAAKLAKGVAVNSTVRVEARVVVGDAGIGVLVTISNAPAGGSSAVTCVGITVGVNVPLGKYLNSVLMNSSSSSVLTVMPRLAASCRMTSSRIIWSSTD